LPRGEAKEAGLSPQKLAAIDALLKTAVEQKKIAGGAALVARQGKVVHLSVAGTQDVEAGVPVTDQTIFRVASMTKPITSVAAMMLVEEGKLSLDDPVAKYIPEFKSMRMLVKDAKPDQPLTQITTAATKPITVRHLLTHTSGITYGFIDKPVLGKLYRDGGVGDGLHEMPGTMADNVKKIAGLPLLFEPGSAWEYGLNTDVLGRVVEVASGMTLDDFFRERILKPLAMNDTHFVLPAEKRSRLMAVHAPDEKKQVRKVGEGIQQVGTVRYSATYSVADDSRYFSGGAGLVSTIGDYARFCQMMLNAGQLDGKRLLQAETVAQMTKNQVGDVSLAIPVHGIRFGLGFGVAGATSQEDPASLGSYSGGGFFHTYFLVDPQKQLVMIFMTQIYPFDHLTLHPEFKRAVYAAVER
jgi:CubicO group peptidase (beta-lactamase class C family)